MKKIISIILCAALIGSCAIIKAADSKDISVIYDGEKISFDVSPEIIGERTMVPMRAIFEAFGAKVKWDGEARTITAKRKSKTIGMTVDSRDMTKNDKVYTSDVAPVIKDGRTLIPIRALSELLELDVDWDDKNMVVKITTPSDDDEDAWKDNVQSIDLSSFTVTGGGSVDANSITITDGGDYTVTGTCDNGQIVVDSKEKVKLRLSGMSLTNPSGSAIYFKNADKAYITVEDGTENFLADGDSYTVDDEKQKGCITARDNLEIKGKGTLNIDANYNNGIHAADSLEIEKGTIIIDSVNDGIHVNETFRMTDGNITINAKGDGIQAEEIIDIIDGKLDITTTGVVASSNNNDKFGRRPGSDRMMEPAPTEEPTPTAESGQTEAGAEDTEDKSSKGIKADWMLDISGGKITLNTTDHAIHSASDLNIKGGKIDITSNNKGISAHGNIIIDDGDINIPKATEGIETKQIMTINGDKFNIIASDDGLNAGGGDNMFGGHGGMGGPGGGRGFGDMDEEDFRDMLNQMETNGQEMRPRRQQKGDSAPDMQEMRPGRGGNIDGDFGGSMMPEGMPDDMIPGGMPPGGFGGGPMMGNSTGISTERHIQINGGEFYIYAKNDGIDSNGSLVIDGGKIIIEGRSMLSFGEMGLDTDMAMIINGGEVLAAGSTISESNAGQNAAVIYLSESAAALSKLEIKSESGKTLISMDVTGTLGEFLYSSPQLEDNKTYSVYVDNELKETFIVSGKVTTVGTAQSSGFGGRGDFGGVDGGFGGGRGGRSDFGGKGDMSSGMMPGDMADNMPMRGRDGMVGKNVPEQAKR
ncbi:MAG: carbohydrate-binding domain-containing protein [Oscillospiraceae bacterium]|nr:carbohydrate-binding domain-containing protein [Oscillospiraceae bacterium]